MMEALAMAGLSLSRILRRSVSSTRMWASLRRFSPTIDQPRVGSAKRRPTTLRPMRLPTLTPFLSKSKVVFWQSSTALSSDHLDATEEEKSGSDRSNESDFRLAAFISSSLGLMRSWARRASGASNRRNIYGRIYYRLTEMLFRSKVLMELRKFFQ